MPAPSSLPDTILADLGPRTAHLAALRTAAHAACVRRQALAKAAAREGAHAQAGPQLRDAGRTGR